MKSFSSPARLLFSVAAAVSIAGALAVTGVSSASAAQVRQQAEATALPAGAHVLTSGSNQYGSYEFVEQHAGTGPQPDNGGGCNMGMWIQVCAAVTGSGLKVDQMTNKTYFPGSPALPKWRS